MDGMIPPHGTEEILEPQDGPSGPNIKPSILMEKCQGAYDAINVSLLSVRRMARDLNGKVDQAVISAGINIAKGMGKYTDSFDDILVTPKEQMQTKEVQDLLIESAGAYQALRLKELEMETLHRSIGKKSGPGRSSCSSCEKSARGRSS